MPGANTQGKTLQEAKSNLKEAIQLVFETHRDIADKSLKSEKTPIYVKLGHCHFEAQIISKSPALSDKDYDDYNNFDFTMKEVTLSKKEINALYKRFNQIFQSYTLSKIDLNAKKCDKNYFILKISTR